MTSFCPYVWGSHGCDLPPDHEGDHVCDHGDPTEWAPDSRPRGHKDVWHYKTQEKETLS